MIEDSSTKFSPSKLSTYKECPQRYKFRYIDGIKKEGSTVEQLLGTCVHSAFEDLYEGLQKGVSMTEAQACAAFEAAWDREFAGVVAGPGGPPDKEAWRRVGLECVRNYYRQHAPFDQDTTAGVERRIGFPIESGGQTYRIEGFVDRLALSKTDGAFEIHDYKTAKTLPPQSHVDEDWQLALYEIGVRHQWPDTKAVRLKWHYVRHGKTLISTRTAEALAALKGEVASLIAEIKRDHEFKARESNLCGWCEYRSLCPLFSHGVAMEAKPAELRALDDGRAAVDEWSALEEKRKALKAEVKRLEEAEKALKGRLADYAARTGHQVVTGTHDEAVVNVKEDYKFPTKTHDPEKLAALEKELLETPLWARVSHFDAHRFLEGWKSRSWPQEWLKKADDVVGRYAQRVAETALRLRRRRDADD